MRDDGVRQVVIPLTQVQRLRLLLAEMEQVITEQRAPTPPAAGVVLDAATCRALEERLGLGAVRSGEDLVAAVDRLGSVHIGEVRLPFTPGQLAELSHRAEKRGRTLEQEVRAVVGRIEEEVFHRGG